MQEESKASFICWAMHSFLALTTASASLSSFRFQAFWISYSHWALSEDPHFMAPRSSILFPDYTPREYLLRVLSVLGSALSEGVWGLPSPPAWLRLALGNQAQGEWGTWCFSGFWWFWEDCFPQCFLSEDRAHRGIFAFGGEPRPKSSRNWVTFQD